jgi:hypothetical protein
VPKVILPQKSDSEWHIPHLQTQKSSINGSYQYVVKLGMRLLEIAVTPSFDNLNVEIAYVIFCRPIKYFSARWYLFCKIQQADSLHHKNPLIINTLMSFITLMDL